MMSRSTLRLTVEDRASAQKARTGQASKSMTAARGRFVSWSAMCWLRARGGAAAAPPRRGSRRRWCGSAGLPSAESRAEIL